MANSTKTAAAAKPKELNNKKKKKKGKGGLIALIVILLVVGGAAVLLYFNVSNIRDMVFDQLRGVPLIGGLIPASTTVTDRFTGMTTDDFKNSISRLERQVSTLTNEKSALQEEVDGLKRENDRLREFEDAQEQFKIDQQAFNETVYNQDPLQFWDYYKQVNPSQADAFAREAAGVAQNEKEVKYYLNVIKNMDEKTAAQAMEVLMDTDSTLVRDIFNALNNAETAAVILDKMGTDKRAALIKLMSPDGMQ